MESSSESLGVRRQSRWSCRVLAPKMCSRGRSDRAAGAKDAGQPTPAGGSIGPTHTGRLCAPEAQAHAERRRLRTTTWATTAWKRSRSASRRARAWRRLTCPTSTCPRPSSGPRERRLWPRPSPSWRRRRKFWESEHISRISSGTQHKTYSLALCYITLRSRTHSSSSKDKPRAALNRFAQRCLTLLTQRVPHDV